MTLKQIDTEALHLSETERAELAQKLLTSLDSPSEDEISEDWLIEASPQGSPDVRLVVFH